MISPSNEFANKKWHYNFRELQNYTEENTFKQWYQKKAQNISKLTAKWNDSLHTEWLIRNFMSARMIMGATLHLNSLDYAQEKNLRVVEPYLEYYSVLHTMRALVLSMPSQNWKNEELLNQNHTAIINSACSILIELNREEGEKIRETILRLKANRELISYRAPSSGHKWTIQNFDINEICILFSEIAQAYSELLENSLLKNYKKGEKYNLKLEDFSILYNPKIDGFVFPDNEDLYRIDYLIRKHPYPTNIYHIISEGHSEDFFGAWYDESIEENDTLFNPDVDWRIIFDIP